MAKPRHCSNLFVLTQPKIWLWIVRADREGVWKCQRVQWGRGSHWNCPAALLTLISTLRKRVVPMVTCVEVRGRHDNLDRFCCHHCDNKPNWTQLCELTLSHVPCPSFLSYIMCVSNCIFLDETFHIFSAQVKCVCKNATHYCCFCP